MDILLQTKLPEVVGLFEEHQVVKAYAFGSVVTEHFNQGSDIDLLVSFKDGLDPVRYGEHYFSLVDKLEALFDRKVDLVTELSLKNPYLIKAINNSKVVLYERSN
jgi:predicted nucleotidyltransferase